MDQQSSGPKRSRDDDEDQHDDATGKSSLGGTDRKKKSERERSRRLDFNSQLRSLRLLLIRVSPELDNSKDRNRLFGNRVEVLNETRNALERLHEENEERSKIIAEMMSTSNSVASLSSGEEEHHSTLNTIPNNRRNQHIDRNIIQQNLRVLQQQHPVVMAANPPVLLPPPLMFFPNPAVLDQLSLVSNGRMIPGVAQDQHFLQQLTPQQAAAGLLQGGGLSLPTRAAGLGLSVNPAFHQQAMAMSSYLEAAQSNPPRQHMMPQVDEELKRKENSIPYYSRGDSNATTASSSRTSASTSRTTSSPSPPPHPEQQL